jgi:hypothetical protein
MAAQAPRAKKARNDDLDERDSATVYAATEHASSGALVTVRIVPPRRFIFDTHTSYYSLHVLQDMEVYRSLHAESVNEPAQFWSRMARENLLWFRDFGESMLVKHELLCCQACGHTT